MNKLLFSLFFVFSTFQGIAQTALSRGEIPQAYHVQFEEDQKKYLEFTNPFAEKAGEAYNLWKSYLKGYLRYNKDSLYAVYESLSKSVLAHKIEFIKQHPAVMHPSIFLIKPYLVLPGLLLTAFFRCIGYLTKKYERLRWGFQFLNPFSENRNCY